MLQLSASLINQPVLSLRTGTVVATTVGPIINPNNLKVEGLFCQDHDHRHKQLVLLYQDIRDIIAQGIVVNDHDVLAEPADLVRLRDIMQLNFGLLGKPVVTVSKDRVGKVTDYAVEMTSMYIQKLYVSQSVFKNFSGGNLGIDRTQIVEITDKRVIINDLVQPTPAHAAATV